MIPLGPVAICTTVLQRTKSSGNSRLNLTHPRFCLPRTANPLPVSSPAFSGASPNWLRMRQTKTLLALTTSHKCNSLPNSDRTSLTVVTRRSVGHSANKARNCATFSCFTKIVMDTVSLVHPSISMRVSHDVVFSRANKGGSPVLRQQNKRKLSDANDCVARIHRPPFKKLL